MIASVQYTTTVRDMLKTKTKNKFEQRIFNSLKKSKVPFKYESEKIPYVFSGHYIPDFVIKIGTNTVYVETKGYLRPEHKRKMVAVKKNHPTYDIRMVFYSFNKQYVRWAEKHGFPYAIGSIPEEWLK